MRASPLSLTRETDPSPETVRAIADGLTEYNAAFRPDGEWTPRYLVGRDAAGAIRSGIKYLVVYDWLSVHWLWVAEAHRGSGEGSRLMQAAEQEARAEGCRGAHLDTFSFQAPGFYAKLGYREFGRIGDYPPGFDRIWLMKLFA